MKQENIFLFVPNLIGTFPGVPGGGEEEAAILKHVGLRARHPLKSAQLLLPEMLGSGVYPARTF